MKAITDSERLDWLQEQIFASGYSVTMKQGVSDDLARQRTVELRTLVGSGPWETLKTKHNLRVAIDASIEANQD